MRCTLIIQHSLEVQQVELRKLSNYGGFLAVNEVHAVYFDNPTLFGVQLSVELRRLSNCGGFYGVHS